MRPILSLLAPPACPACRAPLAGGDDALCAACARGLPWLGAGLCPRCALPRPCAPCPAARAAWTVAWAPLAHAGAARALVGALKFRGLVAAAELLAAPVAAGAPAGLLDGGCVLVPAPGDPRRTRRRGFDPPELIAERLARRTGLPVVRCLRRRGPAARQLGAGRAERRRAGRLAFAVPGGAPPRRAVLVDDVHTTGATLDACARALRAAGTEVVHAVTATRTLP